MLRNLRLRQAPGLACARRGARRDAALDVRCSRPASARLSCPSTCGLHVFPRVSPCLRFSLPAFFGSFSFSVPISLPVFLSCCPYSCVYLSLDQTLPRLALNSFDAVIHIIFEKVRSRVPKSAPQAVLSRMLLTLHATRRTPQGASRFCATNVCLVGENPTCSVPAL